MTKWHRWTGASKLMVISSMSKVSAIWIFTQQKNSGSNFEGDRVEIVKKYSGGRGAGGSNLRAYLLLYTSIVDEHVKAGVIGYDRCNEGITFLLQKN